MFLDDGAVLMYTVLQTLVASTELSLHPEDEGGKIPASAQ